MFKRIEITVHEDTLERLDHARGYEPRASYVKRALETALGSSGNEVPRWPERIREEAPGPKGAAHE